MQLDPSPKIYTPNETSSENSAKTTTLYTKYVFREQPADWVIKGDTIPYEDIASEEFSQVLSVKEDGLLTQQPVPLKLKHEQFPRILFLGTSSADSYLLRNSTGILVHLS